MSSVGSLAEPRGLRTRGRRLWRESVAGRRFSAGELVLLEEACRCADRLDRLQDMIGGRLVWLRIKEQAGGKALVITVDAVLSEARQQQNTLRLALVSLGLVKVAAGAPPAAGEGGEEPKPGGVLVEQLAAARAARMSGTAG